MEFEHVEKAIRAEAGGNDFEDPRLYMPQAIEYVTRALQLDPDYSEAHRALGLVKLLYNWDYAGAASELASARNEQRALTV